MGFSGGGSGVAAPPQVLVFAAEEGSTPAVDTADTGSVNGYKLTWPHTMPVVYPLYKITGIEWKNGAVVNPLTLIACTIDLLDANPPVDANKQMICFTRPIAQGATGVQRDNNVIGPLIPAGTLINITMSINGALGTFRRNIGANQNRVCNANLTAPNIETSAWIASTWESYIKVYYQGLHI